MVKYFLVDINIRFSLKLKAQQSALSTIQQIVLTIHHE